VAALELAVSTAVALAIAISFGTRGLRRTF
jgi:hypothetical protein